MVREWWGQHDNLLARPSRAGSSQGAIQFTRTCRLPAQGRPNQVRLTTHIQTSSALTLCSYCCCCCSFFRKRVTGYGFGASTASRGLIKSPAQIAADREAARELKREATKRVRARRAASRRDQRNRGGGAARRRSPSPYVAPLFWPLPAPLSSLTPCGRPCIWGLVCSGRAGQ